MSADAEALARWREALDGIYQDWLTEYGGGGGVPEILGLLRFLADARAEGGELRGPLAAALAAETSAVEEARAFDEAQRAKAAAQVAESRREGEDAERQEATERLRAWSGGRGVPS